MKKVPIFDKFVGTIILLGSVSVPGFIKIFFKKKYFYLSILCICACMNSYIIHSRSSMEKPEEGVGFPENRVTDRCKLQCGC